MSVRVAIVAESFPPDVNGVAHCALRVAEHLVLRGHQPMVIAPAPARNPGGGGAGPFPWPVVRLPSVPLPRYRSFRIGLPIRRLHTALTSHHAELVHLASPFVLGSSAVAAAGRERLPTVAVYQTDVPAYARVYRTGGLGEAAAWRWLRRIHNAADRTLAPSAASAASLREHGVQRVWLWGRGVDTERFDPARRSPRLRHELAPGGELLVGYVGRLAPEKRVDLLWQVAGLPGVRLVIVGDGPAGPGLRRALPGAMFLGARPAPTWPRSTPAWMCSCTAGRARRSARRCRRPRPAGSRWWRRPWAARWTWSITASPATWWYPATRARSPALWRGSPVTRGCAGRWGGRGGRR